MQEVFERELTPLDRMLGTVADAMQRDLVTLAPRMKGSAAARLLHERGITGAPVVDHGRLVGVFTLSDLMEPAGPTWKTTGPFLRHEHTLAAVEVADMMTKDVITADPGWPLTHAATVMEVARVNRLPVVDALERPVGMLTRHDIVRAVAKRGEMVQHPSFMAHIEEAFHPTASEDRVVVIPEAES